MKEEEYTIEKVFELLKFIKLGVIFICLFVLVTSCHIQMSLAKLIELVGK